MQISFSGLRFGTDPKRKEVVVPEKLFASLGINPIDLSAYPGNGSGDYYSTVLAKDENPIIINGGKVSISDTDSQ